MLDHDQSAALRARLIQTILARHTHQRGAAIHMGLKPKSISDIIKNPAGLIPVDLAATITKWLNQPNPTETPMPSNPEQPTPTATDPASATAAANDLADAQTSPDPASPVTSHQSPVTSHQSPLRVFNHFEIKLDDLVNPHALALIALVDKLPAYKDAAGNGALWFQTFNNLIDFAHFNIKHEAD